MASLYSNENFPNAWSRNSDASVITFSHPMRIPDDQVLAYATEQCRMVLTLNRYDFIRLHQETQGAHAGIMVCTRDDADPHGFAARIHSSLAATGNPAGQLIRIVRPAR